MGRSVKWRRILLIMASVVVVAGIGGTTAAILTYHEATKIDRSNPKVVLDEYLRAALVKDDTVGAELHSCENRAGLASVGDLRKELAQREQEFGVDILVTWGALSASSVSTHTDLTADLQIVASKDGAEQSSSTQTWKFGLEDQDGWRVCSAERLPRVAPSASPTHTSLKP